MSYGRRLCISESFDVRISGNLFVVRISETRWLAKKVPTCRPAAAGKNLFKGCKVEKIMVGFVHSQKYNTS